MFQITKKSLWPGSGAWMSALIPLPDMGWQWMVFRDNEWYVVGSAPYAILHNN